MKKIITAVVAVLLIASFGYTGFFLYEKSSDKPVVYETDSLYITDIVKKAVASGTINPRREVDVKSQVSGVVEKLYVEAGEQVKVGQLIAKIRIIPDVVALNNAEAQLKEAIINFKNAEKELERQRKLYKQEVISEFDYNQFLLTYNLNKQQLDAARNNLDLIKEGASKKTGSASNQVLATVPGMVLNVPVKEGTFVIESNTFNEGTTIATLADMSDMIFLGKVDEAEVGKLSIGMVLSLKVAALEEEAFDAKLEYISPKGIEEEGAVQFEVKASVSLKETIFLRAGYSANADIVLDKKEQVLAVKESNVIFEEDKMFIEVMTGEQEFEKRKILTGLSDGINIEVLEGLVLKDKVKKI